MVLVTGDTVKLDDDFYKVKSDEDLAASIQQQCRIGGFIFSNIDLCKLNLMVKQNLKVTVKVHYAFPQELSSFFHFTDFNPKAIGIEKSFH